jgi:spore cortex biosynthesis protein YabQ
LAVSVSAQTLLFLASCVLGAALGALYDFFKIIRLAVPCRAAAVFFQDVIFLIACTLATFIFFLSRNSGEIRFFIIEGEILGAVIYRFTLSILVMKISGMLIKAVKKIIRSLQALILPPVKNTYAKMGRAVDEKGRKTKKLLIKENKLFKIRLKLIQKVLYNLLHVQKKHNEKPKSEISIRRRHGRGEKAS